TVRAKQSDHAVLRHDDVDAVQHFDAAVGGVHIAQLEHRFGHATSPSEPRYAAWTALSDWISLGVPTAIIRPKSRTWIFAQRLITNSMSCSTSSTQRPCADSWRSK